MFRSNKVFSTLKGLILPILCLFPLLTEAGHLIRLEAVTPFPSSVTTSSTTLATYRVTNISTIPLQGIQHQGILPKGMTMTKGTTCASSTPLLRGGSCLIQLQLIAPGTEQTLSATLREHPLPSIDGVERRFTVSVRSQVPPVQQFTVTPSGDGNEIFTPNTPQTVNANATQSFTVTPNASYTLSAVGGTCSLGSYSGNIYTTGPITANCTVFFTAVQPTTTLGVDNPTILPRVLSVNCPLTSTCTTKNADLTGNPRTITIRNTGSNPAYLTSVTPSGLPTGTGITVDTCSNATLAPNGTCTLTITPGENDLV